MPGCANPNVYLIPSMCRPRAGVEGIRAGTDRKTMGINVKVQLGGAKEGLRDQGMFWNSLIETYHVLLMETERPVWNLG